MRRSRERPGGGKIVDEVRFQSPWSEPTRNMGDAVHDINAIRLRTAVPGGTAGSRGEMDGTCEVQLHRRQQRSGPGAGRRPDRGGRCRAAARGQDARDLWPRQRAAGLPPVAGVPYRQAQGRCRHQLHRRRNPDRLRIVAGARPRQRDAAGPRRYRHHRAGQLSGRAEPADPARRQHGRHSARWRRHADGRAGDGARRSQGARHHAQIYLHHSDRAEPDRHHHARDAPRRTSEAVAAIWRADLRRRLLRRPDLGRKAPARALRDERHRQRHPYRLVFQVDRAGAAGRLHRRAAGMSCRGCWR